MTDPIYRTTGGWGAGKGANLTPAEVDGNFYALAQRIGALETSPPSPVEITNVTVSGATFTVHLSDGTDFGPFTLPTVTTGPMPIVTDSGASVEPELSNAYYVLSNAAAVVLVPGFDETPMPIGTDLVFAQSVGGSVTFTTSTGVALVVPAGKLAKTDHVGAVVRCKLIAADLWLMDGDLAADPAALPASVPAVATITGTTYTPTLAHANTYRRCTNAAGCAVTVPTNASVAFPVGTEITLRQVGAAAVTVAGDTGVTVNTPTGFEAESFGVGATLTLKKVATNEWDMMGLLAVTP